MVAITLSATGTSIGIQAATSSEVVFNESGTDTDLRIEGDTDANLFFVDASTDSIGIGTNTPDGVNYKLDVNGDIRAVDLVSTSDQTLKDFVVGVEQKYDLGELFSSTGDQALRGVVFTWKKLEGRKWNTEIHNIGVFAQEVEALVPELVNTDIYGEKAVRYEKMSALFIERLKQLDAVNKSLEARLTALESA